MTISTNDILRIAGLPKSKKPTMLSENSSESKMSASIPKFLIIETHYNRRGRYVRGLESLLKALGYRDLGNLDEVKDRLSDEFRLKFENGYGDYSYMHFSYLVFTNIYST